MFQTMGLTLFLLSWFAGISEAASVSDTTNAISTDATITPLVSDQVLPTLTYPNDITPTTLPFSHANENFNGQRPPRHRGGPGMKHHGYAMDRNQGFPPPPPPVTVTAEQQQAMVTCLTGYGFSFSTSADIQAALQNSSAISALQNCRSQILGSATTTPTTTTLGQ